MGRSYHSSGLLLSETLTIQTLARTGPGHPYTVSYGYDRNSRRTSMTVGPSSLFTGGAMGYSYDPVWGGLTQVTDIAGNGYSLSYNAASVLTSIGYPGGVSQAFGYDADWRLTSDQINKSGSTAFPQFGSPTVRNFTVSSRNARGQILTANDAANTIAGYPTTSYSGLGHLLTAYLYQKDLQTVTGYQATFESSDSYVYDGLGNILSATEGWGFSSSGGAATANVRSIINTYSATRLTNRQVSQGTTITNTTYTYHGGNVIFESSNKGGIDPINDERASFYGADEKLLAVDHRVVGRKQVEEFRYDPLGRRVWTRFIPTGCGGPPPATIECYTPVVRRVVWDGSQEITEISAPADTTNLATEELDGSFPLQAFQAGVGLSYGDPNPHYGRVVYSPGLAVDQPLSVTRYEYRDLPASGATSLTWPRFTLMVFWDYRGAPAYGLFSDGAWAKPFTLGAGQTTCPNPGNQTTQRCVLFQWPMAQSAYDRNRGKISFPVWHGSILRNKTNGTGHEYHRNRVYDGTTGRFTQEDPAGLAAGLNAYGFANGDPVNFADPFGLAADTLKEVSAQHFSTEVPTQAQRTLCLDQNVSGAAQALVNDAENLIGVTPVFNSAYRDRITAGTGGRRSGGAGSLHLSGFAFDISTRGLTRGQLASFTTLASAYGFNAVAGDPGHYQWRGGDAAYGSHRAVVQEANRSYAAGECRDANVEAVRRGNR